MELSIIFVNWNSLGYLRECLASIYRYNEGASFEVVVVENNSADSGVELLQGMYPNLKVILSKKNLGFAGANNVGYLNSSGRYLLFLNPDTEVASTSIAVMLRALKTAPDAGIVGCKLLNTDGSIQTSCIQTFPTILNQLLDIDALRVRWPGCSLWNIAPLYSETREPVQVEVISGACMLIERETFSRAGMFSEEYFMYAEDLDLCHKVQRLGLKNYYVGGTTVVHHGGKSSSQNPVNQWSTFMKFRAIQKFCSKTHGPLYGLAYRAAIGAAAAVRLLVIASVHAFKKPSGTANSYRFTISKWKAVLKWAFVPGSFGPVQR